MRPNHLLGMLSPSDVALIFDLDNTLIHSRIDFLAIRRDIIGLLRSAGVADRPDQELMRLAIPELVDLGGRFDAGLPERMWQVIRAAEDAGLADADVVEHADDVLGGLAARGFRLGLLTNNSRGSIDERIRALGLHAHFHALATRDDVANLKPSPDGVHYLLARMPPTRRVYVIGDSWIDGRAADAAGARFIGFGPREAEVRDRGVVVWTWITDLRQLLEIDFLDEPDSGFTRGV